MKLPLFPHFALGFLLVACASNPHSAKYKEEKNAPTFGHTRSYAESPSDVKMAARAMLDDLTRESEPPVTASLKESDETTVTGWIYGVAKDKYVEFKMNGLPQRKPLKVRRKYAVSVTPGLAGSEVLFGVEEEVMKIDLKNGKENGWKGEDPDPAAYEMLQRRLKEKLRSL